MTWGFNTLSIRAKEAVTGSYYSGVFHGFGSRGWQKKRRAATGRRARGAGRGDDTAAGGGGGGRRRRERRAGEGKEREAL